MPSLQQQAFQGIKIRALAELELRRRKYAKTNELQEDERKKLEAERNAYYRLHPCEWVTARLEIPPEHLEWSLLPAYRKHKWDGTKDPIKKMLEALAHKRWPAVEGGTGVSKTFFAACAALWFLECFEDSMVVTTAPKKDQLELHIWKEISRLWPKFRRGKLMTLELRMAPDAPGDQGWKAIGFVAGVKAEEVGQSARRAQGFHGKDMLMIVEETPGVHEAVLTALQNTSVSPNNLIMALGNPDHQMDTLHKFSRLNRVDHIIISGFDHPNVVLKDPNFIPGAQSEQGLKDMLERAHGNKDNPLYLSRARGISPKQAKDALIRYEWLMKAVERRRRYEDSEGKLQLSRIPGMRALGVDVANSEDGDKAAEADGKGAVLLEVEDFPCPNANKLGEKVFGEMKARGIADQYVGVDGVGVGAGTVNELKRLGANITNIISSEAPVEIYDQRQTGNKLVEEFDNLRSQMWWQMRSDLENPASDICLPHDEILFADLMSPKWTIRNGKIVVQSKQEMKKLLGRSPNKGDAVVYWNWVRSTHTGLAAMQGMTIIDPNAEKKPTEEESTGRKSSYRYTPIGRKRREHSF